MPERPSDPTRAPRQERSRQSWERAVDAVIALLAERGDPGFTLAEVAARSGVSTGSIYARVDSKDDLIRAAHARLLEKLAAETTTSFGTAPAAVPPASLRPAFPASASLEFAVGQAVTGLAELLRRNAPALGPMMAIARFDPVMKTRGDAAYDAMARAFTARLRLAGNQIRRADADSALAWSCTLVYAVLARELGLGSDPTLAYANDWADLLRRLTDTVTAYLSLP